MKVFLAVGNEELENRIRAIDSITVVDSESNLETIIGLLEFIKVDCLILNRLLDADGTKLQLVAKKALESGIKIIMLVDNFEGFKEKKLIALLVNEGVHSYLTIRNFSEENLLYEMMHYPEAFDFNLLKADDAGEQEDKMQEKVMPKIVHIGFTRKILTIWDNAEYGCELAYVAAKMTGLKVLLIDADLLAPRADSILNVERTPRSIASEGLFTGTGLNIVLDSLNQNTYRTEILYAACVGRSEVRNLHVLTGNYEINNYEYYTKESYLELLEKAYQNFDITVVLVNRSMYDLFTILSLLRSDYNIVPVEANLLNIREYNSYFEFLEKTQKLQIEKNKYVAYEYRNGLNLDKHVISSLVGNNLLGYVSYDHRRVRYRNLRPAYAKRMPENIRNEYIDMLSYFDIAGKRTLKDKLKAYFSRYKVFIRIIKKIAKKNIRKKVRG